MTITKNATLDKPGTSNVLSYATGVGILGAGGTFTQALPGFSDGALAFAGYDGTVFVVGNAGFLTVSYNQVTGVLTVQSSNAADRNTVSWALLD